MIFRWLEKRRLERAFGEYISRRTINEMLANKSEWDSFKSLLPLRIWPMFFTPVMTERQALMEVSRMANEALIMAQKAEAARKTPSN